MLTYTQYIYDCIRIVMFFFGFELNVFGLIYFVRKLGLFASWSFVKKRFINLNSMIQSQLRGIRAKQSFVKCKGISY